jgi:hypothetical protein
MKRHQEIENAEKLQKEVFDRLDHNEKEVKAKTEENTVNDLFKSILHEETSKR